VKLIACIAKCHDSRAAGKLADDTAEDACEKSLTTGKSCTAKFAGTIAKLKGCPPCINGTTMASLASAVEALLDANNGTIYCAGPGFAHFVTTNLPGTSNCGGPGLSPLPSPPLGGAIFSDTACTTKLADLGLACFDSGGGNAINVPPGPVVDGASTVFDISGSNLVASSGTGPRDCTKGAGPGKHCIGLTNNGAACTDDTSCDVAVPGSCALVENCFSGPPLPIANGGLSTCVINVIQTDASGTADLTTGASTVHLPLFSRTYLTGNAAAPCPKCISGTCNAGPKAGMPCTPVGTQLTTLDCPPSPAGLLSPFAVNLNPLSTSGASNTAADGNFCPGQSNTMSTTTGFSGAFGFMNAECIKENGSPAGDLTDGNPHPAVLGSVFCIPATGSVVIDAAADLPGPGAITLNVNTQATH
jgi:hypothetical protein